MLGLGDIVSYCGRPVSRPPSIIQPAAKSPYIYVSTCVSDKAFITHFIRYFTVHVVKVLYYTFITAYALERGSGVIKEIILSVTTGIAGVVAMLCHEVRQ